MVLDQTRMARRVAAVVLTSLLVFGCGGIVEPKVDPNAYIRATVDGTKWEATAKYTYNGLVNGRPNFTVSATKSDKSLISLVATGVTTVGTYSIGAFTSPSAIATIRTASGSYGGITPGAGTLVITEYSATRLAGTFALTAESTVTTGSRNTILVSEGTFSVPVK